MKKFLAAFFIFASVTLCLHAEVYSLFPFGKRASSSADTSDALLSPRRFWNERITVNGAEHELSVSLVDMPMRDAVLALRKKFPSVPYAVNSNSLLMELPLEKGFARRVYLLELPGIYSVLEFRMDVPLKRPEGTPEMWPRLFPLLAGAKDITVMSFPVREADYGTYSVPGATVPAVLADVSGRLKASGWNAVVEGGGGDLYSGAGGVFTREKPLRMLILGVSETKDGRAGVKATFYSRPVE